MKRLFFAVLLVLALAAPVSAAKVPSSVVPSDPAPTLGEHITFVITSGKSSFVNMTCYQGLGPDHDVTGARIVDGFTTMTIADAETTGVVLGYKLMSDGTYQATPWALAGGSADCRVSLYIYGRGDIAATWFTVAG